VSTTVSLRLIRGVDRRSLATAVSDKMPFDGAMWTILTVGQMGPDAPPAVTVHSESAGKVDVVPLTDCKVIAQHIETGDETGFKSITKAASTTGIAHTPSRPHSWTSRAARKVHFPFRRHICAGNLLRSWNWT
jgi:hypothetical protein